MPWMTFQKADTLRPTELVDTFERAARYYALHAYYNAYKGTGS